MRQVGLGILVALISVAVVFGSLLLAFAEGGSGLAFLRTPTATPTSLPMLTPLPTLLPGQPTFTPTASFSATPGVPVGKPGCAFPEGWVARTVQADDSLESLAQASGLSVDALMQANCLLTTRLLPGAIVYLPPATEPPPADTPVPSKTPVPCGPPPGWVPYRVRPGDTLYSLALATGSTVRQLQIANCLGSSSNIQAGQVIYLPRALPSATFTSTPTRTITPTKPGPLSSADLSITLNATPDPVIPGALLDYSITLNNAGPDAASNLVVTDNLPGGVTFISGSGSGWSCSNSGAVVTCTRPSLAVGASAALTITGAVSASASGSIANQVNISSVTSDPNTSNNTASVTVTVNVQADLEVSLAASTGSALVDDTLNYTITVNNNGPSTASSVDVVAVFSGVSVTNISSPPGCIVVSSTVTCNLASLATGGTATIDVSVQVTGEGTLSNQVSVSSSTPDPNSANNADSHSAAITAEADLEITSITPNPLSAAVSDTVTFTIVVTNNGPNPATSVDVVAVFSGVSVANISSPGCSVNPGLSTVKCSAGNLAAGGTATFSIDVDVTSAGTLTCQVDVSSATADLVIPNNTASVDVTIT